MSIASPPVEPTFADDDAAAERLLVSAARARLAADMMSVSVRHVRCLQEWGVLVPVRIGGAVPFRLDDSRCLAGMAPTASSP